ncbi:MAG: hypothetical protein H0W09_06000 [Solirubrobacterales bacterium]|nr:hypothetical protein [Solirubrobacterales bacterium]
MTQTLIDTQTLTEPDVPRVLRAAELVAPARLPLAPAELERAARRDLRGQIADLETELSGLFTTGFPRRAAGIDWRVGAAGGPRLLGIAELERTRDALVSRIAEVRAELYRRADAEEESRVRVEQMIADPEQHRWSLISNEHLGDPGCKHFHVRPRWGIVGMLMNWWRVKVSSGCPLAEGHALAALPLPTASKPLQAPGSPRAGWILV